MVGKRCRPAFSWKWAWRELRKKTKVNSELHCLKRALSPMVYSDYHENSYGTVMKSTTRISKVKLPKRRSAPNAAKDSSSVESKTPKRRSREYLTVKEVGKLSDAARERGPLWSSGCDNDPGRLPPRTARV